MFVLRNCDKHTKLHKKSTRVHISKKKSGNFTDIKQNFATVKELGRARLAC